MEINNVIETPQELKGEEIIFPTDYEKILERLKNVDPIKYARSRNFTDGTVTYLSPYISRGVISLQQIKQQALQNYKPYQIQKFLQELAWREYFQRVWQSKEDEIFSAIKKEQPEVAHNEMVTAVDGACTGLEAIDEHIKLLYGKGYMHNHVRMYVSSIVCNIAKAHWLIPSQWMYYHLLDGDLASNTLNWQWVAGTFSSKKYYCNQENINRYTHSNQQNTFLDGPYETITSMQVPEVLKGTNDLSINTNLPQKTIPLLNNNLPVIVYNSYNLDPLWHAEESANRILLLEPGHFEKYPVSDKVIQFILGLAKNIKGIQIFTADFEELKKLCGSNSIIYKIHPTCSHYEGTSEKYDELFPEVTGYYASFSSYWKKCAKYF